jgi:hypothetical protein
LSRGILLGPLYLYFVLATIFRTPFGTGRRTESGRPQNWEIAG